MSVGDNIARLRRKKGWTQARLAEGTGFSRGYIAAIEQGRSYPTLKTIALIADKLGVGLEEIKTGRRATMKTTEERIFSTAYKETCKDEIYKNNIKRIIEIGRMIMACMDPCQRSLFLEYDRLAGISHGIYLEYAYTLGFEDGRRAQQNAQQKN